MFIKQHLNCKNEKYPTLIDFYLDKNKPPLMTEHIDTFSDLCDLVSDWDEVVARLKAGQFVEVKMEV